MPYLFAIVRHGVAALEGRAAQRVAVLDAAWVKVELLAAVGADVLVRVGERRRAARAADARAAGAAAEGAHLADGALAAVLVALAVDIGMRAVAGGFSHGEVAAAPRQAHVAALAGGPNKEGKQIVGGAIVGHVGAQVGHLQRRRRPNEPPVGFDAGGANGHVGAFVRAGGVGELVDSAGDVAARLGRALDVFLAVEADHDFHHWRPHTAGALVHGNPGVDVAARRADGGDRQQQQRRQQRQPQGAERRHGRSAASSAHAAVFFFIGRNVTCAVARARQRRAGACRRRWLVGAC